MRKQMLLVNLILLAAALGLGWKLRADWRRGSERYAALSSSAAPAISAVGAPAAPGPVAGAEVIVAANLFSADRNNEQPKAAEKKMPPEPILIGTMNLGPGKKIALLQDRNARDSMPRQVKEGETFADFKLVAIGDNQVTLEFEGQRKKIDVSNAIPQISGPPSITTQRAAEQPQVVSTTNQSQASQAASSNPQVLSTAPPNTGPTGKLIPGTTSMYGYDDGLPAGTIIGDRRKVIRASPFGAKEIWWEVVKPEDRKPK